MVVEIESGTSRELCGDLCLSRGESRGVEEFGDPPGMKKNKNVLGTAEEKKKKGIKKANAPERLVLQESE